MEILYTLAGVLVGFAIAFLWMKSKLRLRREDSVREKQQAEQMFTLQKFELEKEKSLFADRYNTLFKERDELLRQMRQLQVENGLKSQQLARNEADFANLHDKLDGQKKEMERLQQKFTTEFENIASRILKQNTADFSISNQKSITEMLLPLKEKIQLFEKKVEDTYEKGLKDQTDLKAELKKLQDMNLRISDEANNLTKALKGDVKKQGNWGEMILEKILERSGLTEGQEYIKQQSMLAENGQRYQPDIVINLPDQKHIVVDSKVSLVAYERLVNAESEAERQLFVREHLLSLRNHIRMLNEKNYQHSPVFNTPDFVLLFIPIESSFSIAVQEDQELFTYAWDNKVVIVSPSTLLATLRTISSIWQQENQTRNSIEIARQSGALYDKFVAFITDMDTIGRSLESARKNYDLAVNKLYVGSGNLVRRAENIRKLGAKASKELPPEMTGE